MKLETQIESRIQKSIKTVHLEVINESHMHTRGQETHFKVIVVSDEFKNLSKVKRQQLVYATVKDLFEEGLHAFSQATYTPEEWAKDPELNSSPICVNPHKE